MSLVSQQTGTLTFGASQGDSDTLSTTVTAANSILEWSARGGGDRADGASFAIFLHSDGTTVEASRQGNTDTGLIIDYVVTERTEFTVQHVSTAATATATEKDVTFTAVDLAYSYIIHGGYVSSSSSSFGNNELSTVKFTSTTTALAEFSSSPNKHVVRLQIVEMSSAEIASVQFVDEATYVENTTGTTSTITSVDVDKTLLFGSQRTSSSPLLSRGAAALSLADSTTLDIESFSSSSSGTAYVSCFIVEFVNLDVVHKSSAVTGLTDTVAYGSTPTYPSCVVNGGLHRASALANDDDSDEERFGVSWSGGTATFTRTASSVNANLRASVYDWDTLDAAGGTFTLTADSGSYTYTGTAATLVAGRVLALDSGTYTYSGTAANLARGYSLAADSGSYVYTGTALSILSGRVLTADSGPYTYTGTAAVLTFAGVGAFTLTVDSGSYTYNGTVAALQVGRVLTASSGSYAYNGTTIGLNLGRILAAASGSYTYTGTALAFSKTSVLAADSGTYTYRGIALTLDYSGASVWTKQNDSVTSWLDQADSITAWTPQADNSTTWTEQ